MKKSILYGLGLLAGAAGLNGMDTEQPFTFFELPSEVCRVIISFALEEAQRSYEMANAQSEVLHIPYTLRPINPVVCMATGDANPDSWEPKEGEKILLDHQLWLGRLGVNLFKIRLEHDSADNHDTFNVQNECGYARALFDGINKKRCALLVLNAFTDADGSCVYLFRQSPLGSGTVTSEKIEKKLFSLPGYIQSAMLHPDENRIMYSFKGELMPDAMDIDSGNKENALQFYYGLSLCDVDDADTKHTIASQDLDVLMSKTIYLGGNRYLGLTNEGKLAHIWLNEDSLLRHSMINLKKWDDQTKTYVPSDSVVKDIAVDDACRTPDGVRRRIAYITSKGEVFVMDFGCFKKPAPLLNKVVERAASVFRLFYDKGELAVLYADKQNRYQDFVRWPDNLGALYLKAVLVQQERSLQN